MEFAVPPSPIPVVPVIGGAVFPVRRIFCVGRNYAAHAREMGHDPDREPPFFFTKPADAILLPGQPMPYPPATADLHHEIELVVAIGRAGAEISVTEAQDHVFGYAVGLDMTRRDLQGEAKKLGRPWDMGKGFDFSAPIAPLHRASETGPITKGAIWLDVNGTRRQVGDIADLIWSVPEVIASLSRLVALAPGDLIYTGTPEGVAATMRGDRLHGHVDGLSDLELAIGR
ncbi:MAG: fumarylacetoacetate hydrolase family protein [Aliidongia sp.]